MSGNCSCTCIGSQINYMINMTIEEIASNATTPGPKVPAGKGHLSQTG